MTRSFSARIGSKTFEDPALFEVAAKDWRAPKTPARKAWGVAPTTGEAETWTASIRRGWKPSRTKALFEAKPWTPGAEVETAVGPAQVWDLAPRGGVWVVYADGRALWADPKTGALRTAAEGFVIAQGDAA